MKIRIITQNPLSVWFWWIEFQANKYIENLKKKWIDIDFFKWDEKNFDILHIVWIHSWINPYWIDTLKKKWIKIIVSSVFYLKPNYFLDFRRPFVYKIFSYIPHHIVNWMKHLLSKADLILPNSNEEMLQLINVFWLDKNKIQVLYNWVDWDYFDDIDINSFRDTYKIKNYIICVSHIEPRKNHLNLIKWFLEFKGQKDNLINTLDKKWNLNKKIIEKEYNDLKLVLLWDYRGNYFDYHNQVKKIIEDNVDSIIHINNLDNQNKLFKSAYLWSLGHFLLSSLETPWLSNLEAWLASNRLVMWDCKPVREYYNWYWTYINPKNIDEIKNEIAILLYKKILENKGILIDKEKDIQIAFIKQNYSWDSITDKLLEFYKNLLWK